MQIRIMHIVDSLGVGGLENGLVNLIERLDPSQFQHIVCSVRGLGPMADRLPADRVRIIDMGKTDGAFPIQIGALARRIREVKPHIVHSRNWGAVEAVVAGRWTRSCALVHSEHGIDVSAVQSEPARRNWFRRLAFELADRVFSVSNQLRELYSRRTGFPAKKIDVIYNGVDSERFAPDASARERVRQELGIAADEFCIGAVGRLDPIKDYRTLLNAAEKVAEFRERWQVLVLGEGPEQPQLQEWVDSRPKLKAHVRFLGRTTRVSQILNAFDAYVLSSISEGISNSLLEAMATGLPVVASVTGGNPEVAVDGESGMLFPVGDSGRLAELLMTLSRESELRHRLGKNALRRVREQYSMESMIRNYHGLYCSLAQQRAA